MSKPLFHDFIRRRREELGLSLQQMADLCGFPEAHYMVYEEGIAEPPHQHDLHKIAMALQMSFSELARYAERRYY